MAVGKFLGPAAGVLLVGVFAGVAAGFPISPTLQMLLSATLTVYVGACAGLSLVPAKDGAGFVLSTADREPAMTHADAARMPFVAGGALAALYVALQHGGPLVQEIVIQLLKVYLLTAGAYAVGALLEPVLSAVGGLGRRLFTFPRIPFLLTGEPDSRAVTGAGALGFLVGAAVAFAYGATGHWAANNVLGAAFCVLALRLGNVGSFAVAAAILCALFAYDVLAVFGSKAALSYFAGRSKASIMEVVATRVDGPIKLVFPFVGDAAEAALAAGRRSHSLLGLGDIVFPGLLVAFLARFDVAQALEAAQKAGAAVTPSLLWSCPKPYLNATILSYVAGLAGTVVAMHHMETAQPALLYLVPAVLAAPLLLAAARGELRALFAFREEEAEGEGERKQEGDGKAAGSGPAPAASGSSAVSPAASDAASAGASVAASPAPQARDEAVPERDANGSSLKQRPRRA